MSPSPAPRPWRRLLDRWQGVLLTLVVGVATLWLAATGQLVLYIHPRYDVFTVVMIVIGMLLSLATLAFSPVRGEDEGDHAGHDHADHDHDGRLETAAVPAVEDGLRPRRRRPLATGVRRLAFSAGLVVTTAIAIAVVAVPPATLTSATAGQRDVNSSTAALDRTSVADATSASSDAYRSFSVLDWAGLLRQTTDLAFYQGKTADVVGFVTPSDTDPDDVFYVSRFVITCCAVDAQPVGVPVYLPGWQDQVAADDWVEVTGGFDTNRSSSSQDPVALVPDDVTTVGQPSDPYLY
ncbi:TIGR03943 family protein [Frigoribacterium sp. VKM Ac-2836]|uniref:TIGR03943 family putative permease subunit n=1 Tax=Frigoribacterium sp. VKM Ac-2836 TaxID=2739014 RepID=UPI0015647C65|nr:TIGR03943 family protein [Frigoribacterium sp. VKM Ac-2836]NRD27500.1 TIGR03943 family protein [Frigoribacterium sp. VKM Ac-2836]